MKKSNLFQRLRVVFALTAIFLAAALSTASAQQEMPVELQQILDQSTNGNGESTPQTSPQNERLGFRPRVDRDDEEIPFDLSFDREKLEYQVGEQFFFEIDSRVGGYFYVINVTGDKYNVIYPSDVDLDNKVRAGERKILPDEFAGYHWRVSNDSDMEIFITILVQTKLSEEELNSIINHLFSNGTLPRRNNVAASDFVELERNTNCWARAFAISVVDGASSSEPQSELDSDRAGRVAYLFSQTHIYDAENEKFIQDRNFLFRAGNYIRLKRALQDFGQFDEIVSVCGSDLNKERVYEAFEEMKSSTNPGDEIFIYWEGHGMQWPESSSESDGVHESFLLATTASFPSNEGVVDPTPETIISDDEFADLLGTLSERKTMLVVTTCHSGGIFEDGSFDQSSRAIMKDVDSESITAALDELADLPYDYKEVFAAASKLLDSDESDSHVDRVESVALPANVAALLNSNSNAPRVQAASTAGIPERLARRIVARAKDVGFNTPNLAIFAACAEEESAFCATVLDDDMMTTPCGEVELPIGPTVFTMLVAMTDESGKYVKNAGKVEFDDFATIARRFIPENARRIESQTQASQIPCYMNNVEGAMLRP